MNKITSYTDCNNKVTFKVGNKYDTYVGTYEVVDMEIDPNDPKAEPTIMVQYPPVTPSSQPLVQVLELRKQGRIISNARRRKKKQANLHSIPFDSQDYYFTVGYMAVNGFVRVECPESVSTSFAEVYNYWSGDSVDNHIGNGYCIVADKHKWQQFEMRLKYTEPNEQISSRILTSTLPIRATNDKLEINFMDYVSRLFRLGFTLGNNAHNVDLIMNRIDPKYHISYIEGIYAMPQQIALAA